VVDAIGPEHDERELVLRRGALKIGEDRVLADLLAVDPGFLAAVQGVRVAFIGEVVVAIMLYIAEWPCG
jgi:hypothetical protein